VSAVLRSVTTEEAVSVAHAAVEAASAAQARQVARSRLPILNDLAL